jgi:hypothetical protein
MQSSAVLPIVRVGHPVADGSSATAMWIDCGAASMLHQEPTQQQLEQSAFPAASAAGNEGMEVGQVGKGRLRILAKGRTVTGVQTWTGEKASSSASLTRMPSAAVLVGRIVTMPLRTVSNLCSRNWRNVRLTWMGVSPRARIG